LGVSGASRKIIIFSIILSCESLFLLASLWFDMGLFLVSISICVSAEIFRLNETKLQQQDIVLHLDL
jgi:hypothetical protein